MRLTLLLTSPRVAPGLMSWPAWQSVASADRVLASSLEAPVARAVLAAGHRVDVLPAPSARDLVAAASSGSVVWLASDEESERLGGLLAAEIVAAGAEDRTLPEVEVLHGSYDVPGARLLDLVAVMDVLRTGCPWDRKQTHRSLARHLLEECYETLEAIESGSPADLREELGDLLLQVVFHARVASEDPEAGFDVDDVAGGIVEKLVSRHPHVFGGPEASDAEEVEASWEALKAAEKGRTSALDGIPLSLPALALAGKVVARAARAGVPVTQLEAQPEGGSVELGDRLLALVVEAGAAGVDPEQTLRGVVRRLATAVRDAERALRAPGGGPG